MPRTAVYGIFETKQQVDQAARNIHALNLLVSVSGLEGTRANSPKFWHNIDSSSDTYLLIWMVIGAIAGTVCGFMGIRTEGVHLVPALAFLSAICGAAVGAFLGLLAGGILELEVALDKNRRTRKPVGTYLVVTHAHSTVEVRIVEQLMAEAGAVEMQAKKEEYLY